MIMQTHYLLSGTEYRYAMQVDRPLHAKGNLYSVFVILTALIPAHPPAGHLPPLSAWGKHAFDARENLEGEIRAWLVHGDERLR